jgi:hypothetical protein
MNVLSQTTTTVTAAQEDQPALLIPPVYWSYSCNEGWIDAPLTVPGTECIDNDECENGEHLCNLNSKVCVNRLPPVRYECAPRTLAPTQSPTPAPVSNPIPIIKPIVTDIDFQYHVIGCYYHVVANEHYHRLCFPVSVATLLILPRRYYQVYVDRQVISI